MNPINSDQYISQKDWSNKFHYGFDYFLSPHNQINFYAFYNPFSNGRNGNADSKISSKYINIWTSQKIDFNINTCKFYSIYYKHIFEKTVQENTFDNNNFNLIANNSTDYIDKSAGNIPDTLKNIIKPYASASISYKMDISSY